MSVNGSSKARPFSVAIVGAGPSGFYAAEALLRASDEIAVWMFEKLPVPYGLVRYGVAPDHPKLKSVTAVFDRIAAMEGFHFCGNVEIGRDLSAETLQEHFHAVIFAQGAASGAKLGIPGEELAGSHTAHAFVAWYNGHPDFRDLPVDLSTETAAVIGNGNVALDVARILAKPVDALRETDIADHALEVLAESKIREVNVIGRRGPAQVQFVAKELREFGETEGFRSVVDREDLLLSDACHEEIAGPNAADLKLCNDLLNGFQNMDVTADRICRFRFLLAPEAIEGKGKVTSLKLRRNRLTGAAFSQRAEPTDRWLDLPCGLVVSSVGYRPATIAPLALAPSKAHLENSEGRLTRDGDPLPGFYVAGWAKRGPKGTIGTNRGDSQQTVTTLLEDKAALALGQKKDPQRLLRKPGLRSVSYQAWRDIDAQEKAQGAKSGRPRVKMTSIREMLDACFKPA